MPALALLAGLTIAQGGVHIPPDIRYAENGRIRIGIDLAKGGAITYLAKKGGPNLVNDFDLGRQIQMSYYSGPVPFTPRGKQPSDAWRGLGWNPIQVGDCYGHPSKTLVFKSSGNRLYVKCIPMQWPLDDEPGECTFESWIELDGDAVRVRNRITDHRTDRTQYPGRTQELPAVYTNGPWYRLVTYSGDMPFSDAPLDTPPDGFPWTSFQATENWTALVDDHGDGLGVWAPGIQAFSGGFAGKPGAGGPSDAPTGYIAPNREEILDSNIAYDNEYSLVVGSLKEIRDWVYAQPRPAGPPNYRFRRDRQHWVYINATDTGWPIKGALDVRMEVNDPQMIGPREAWSAKDAPKLHIRCALRAQGGRQAGQVFWARLDAQGFSQNRCLSFPIEGDGREREVVVDLAPSHEYRGTITQMRFDPEPIGHPGDRILVKAIWLSR